MAKNSKRKASKVKRDKSPPKKAKDKQLQKTDLKAGKNEKSAAKGAKKKQPPINECKRDGYYEPWNVDIPWENLRERFQKMHDARIPKPVIYTGDQRRTVQMIRGLEYYEFLRSEVKRLAALKHKPSQRAKEKATTKDKSKDRSRSRSKSKSKK